MSAAIPLFSTILEPQCSDGIGHRGVATLDRQRETESGRKCQLTPDLEPLTLKA